MIVSRPLTSREPDLLKGNETRPLCFIAIDGGIKIKEELPPTGRWTHDTLEAVATPNKNAWDAFLGNHWVGSSEV